MIRFEDNIKEWTQDYLDLEWVRAQRNVETLGAAYDACTGVEYLETQFGMINLKEDLGDQIFHQYAYIGSLMKEYERRNINTPMWG